MAAYQNAVYGGLKKGQFYGKAMYESFNARWFRIMVGKKFQDRDIKLARQLDIGSDYS